MIAASVALTGCAVGPARGPVRPLPPQEGCEFPGREELAQLASRADLIAVGRADSVEVKPVEGIPSREDSTFTEFSVARILTERGKDQRVASRVSIFTSGGRAVENGTLLTEGKHYVVFLFRMDGDAPNWFGVLDGAAGRFLLEGGRVFRFCPNYSVGGISVFASGAGQGQRFEAFAATLASVLEE